MCDPMSKKKEKEKDTMYTSYTNPMLDQAKQQKNANLLHDVWHVRESQMSSFLTNPSCHEWVVVVGRRGGASIHRTSPWL